MTYKTASIGEFFQWTMTVAKDPKRAGEQPKQWFDSAATAKARSAATSPEAMVRLLSADNLSLLKLIAAHEFASMRELAEASKRKESNLSVTLRKFADAGIIRLERKGKTLRPRLAASRVTLDLDLLGRESMVSVVHTHG